MEKYYKKIDFNKFYGSVLHSAVTSTKSTEILNYLISLGVDKSIRTDKGETAYDTAKRNKSYKRNNTDYSFLKVEDEVLNSYKSKLVLNKRFYFLYGSNFSNAYFGNNPNPFNKQKQTMNPIVSSNYNLGFDFNYGKFNFKIEPGITTKGYQTFTKQNDANEKIQLRYIEMPLLVNKLFLNSGSHNSGFSFGAGLDVSYLIGTNINYIADSGSDYIKGNFKRHYNNKFELAAVSEISFLRGTSLAIGVRYKHGLTPTSNNTYNYFIDANSNEEKAEYHRSFQVFLSIQIHQWR